MSAFVETKIERERSHPSGTSWSPEEYRALFERVEREAKEAARKRAHARAWELARRQGVKPIKSIKELQGDFWPEDESVDEFLELVRSIRHQDKISSRTSE
jgi:hypothetical protein